jgi:hypothetical protein
MVLCSVQGVCCNDLMCVNSSHIYGKAKIPELLHYAIASSDCGCVEACIPTKRFVITHQITDLSEY